MGVAIVNVIVSLASMVIEDSNMITLLFWGGVEWYGLGPLPIKSKAALNWGQISHGYTKVMEVKWLSAGTIVSSSIILACQGDLHGRLELRTFLSLPWLQLAEAVGDTAKHTHLGMITAACRSGHYETVDTVGY